MASVKWEGGKYHGAGETKAHFRHDEKEQRMLHEHTNKDINKGQTQFNYSMNGLTYAEMCEKYDKRIAELAPNTRMTKVTVTCQNLEIPVPAGLPEDKQPEWFRRVYELIVDFAGKENVIDGNVHVDEKHTYMDAKTGEWRTSREHMHVSVIPEVDGKLNGKAFSARKNINRLNSTIHKMSIQEFGIPFHTGKGGKSPETVDELKNKSATLEAELDAVIEARADADVELFLAEQEAAKIRLEAIKYAKKREKEADDLKVAVASEKTSYEQKNEELDNLIAEGKECVNSPSSVSEDNDSNRKAFMETIKYKNGMTAEDYYQRELIRKRQAETERKAKIQAFIDKDKKVRKPDPLKQVLVTAEDAQHKTLGKSNNMQYS